MKNPKTKSHKYLVANETDTTWGLHITTIGAQSIRNIRNYPPNDHPSPYWFDPAEGRILQEYQIIYLISGEGIFQSTGTDPISIQPGSIFLLFPGEWHNFYPKNKSGWETYWIGFKGQNIDTLIENHFFSKRQPVFDIGFNEQLIGLFEQGIEIANHQKTSFQPMLAGITQLMLSIIFYHDRNNSFRDKDIINKIDQARMIMRNTASHPTPPETIAIQLNMSYSWFRRVFKQYTGFSPAQYQMEIKIQKAKELLSGTAMPVKEIAWELSFESPSHFVTFFKSKVGVSPGAYRTKTQ